MSEDPRPQIIEVCHLLAERNFTTATGGNISVRQPDGTFWVTPSHVHKARVQQEDLIQVNTNGYILNGTQRPSSELFMHLAVYRALPKAGAVIHAHPPYSSGFAQACQQIDTSSSSEAYVILGPHIPLIPYAPPASQELAMIVHQAMEPRHKVYLLSNHGVIIWGKDLWEAYDCLDTLELFSQSLLVATLLGGPTPLSDEELQVLEEKYISLSVEVE
ncbi:MAG TPA: class II aldolase/adducin family protein [Armatimonadota bacterium]|jgi:L-fuculose-phosphate aldolase